MTKYLSIRSGATALPENSVAHLTIDLIKRAGVVSLVDDHLKVEESNPQGLSVKINVGRLFLKKTDDMIYHGYSDAEETVSLTANSSGNTRIDAIVAYVDKAVSPNSDASNDVLKFTAVAGTPASSPVAPTDNEIATALGASNPFERIAEVEVVNGASAIANGKITDKRRRFRTVNTNEIKSLSYNASIQLDGDDTNIFEVEATGDITFSVTNFEVGEFVYLRIARNAATAPNYTFWAGIEWADGSAPDVSANGEADALIFFKRGASSWDGYISAQGIN